MLRVTTSDRGGLGTASSIHCARRDQISVCSGRFMRGPGGSPLIVGRVAGRLLIVAADSAKPRLARHRRRPAGQAGVCDRSRSRSLAPSWSLPPPPYLRSSTGSLQLAMRPVPRAPLPPHISLPPFPPLSPPPPSPPPPPPPCVRYSYCSDSSTSRRDARRAGGIAARTPARAARISSTISEPIG